MSTPNVLRRSRKECNGRRRRAYRVHQEAATTEEMPLLSYRRRSKAGDGTELTTRRRRLISPFHRRSRRASRVVVMARSGSRVGGNAQLDRQKSEEAMEGSDEGGGAKEMGSSERYFPGRSRPKQ
ncbi:hypothetical protein BHE74_00019377 [Ensete ventricosum]|nr:hypothetical protein BHE74_00019377 [Ensete ventricosum]